MSALFLPDAPSTEHKARASPAPKCSIDIESPAELLSATTSDSFIFTARVAGVLGLLLPPLRLRLVFAGDERKAFGLVRDCAKQVLRLSGCRVEMTGDEFIPRGGPAMLVSNHVSLADAAVLLGVLPLDFRFVAGHGYVEYPLLGAAIRGASANIVNRGSLRSRADSAQAMVDSLAGGQSLLVFPEGTTADDGHMLPFRNGEFRAAARTAKPVVPIAIRGTREMFPAGATRLSNVPVTIEILPSIQPSGDTRDAVFDLRDRAKAAIQARLMSK